MSASLITRAALLAGTAMLVSACNSSSSSGEFSQFTATGSVYEADYSEDGSDPAAHDGSGKLSVTSSAGGRVTGISVFGASEDGGEDIELVSFDTTATTFKQPKKGEPDNTPVDVQVKKRDRISQNGNYLVASRYFQDEDDPDLTDAGHFADPRAFGFEYQTYGVWVTGMDGSWMPRHTAGAGTFGLESGAVTALVDDKLPLDASGARYEGGATGVYARPELVDGKARFAAVATTADLLAVVEYNGDSPSHIDFKTTGTIGFDVENPAVTEDLAHLDLTGQLNISGNQFFGEIDTAGDLDSEVAIMNGTADGNFYGPNAEEIGGKFEAGSTESGIYIGAFGGKR